MDRKILEKIGMTRNESIVYLALLQLRTSKIGEILKASQLNSGKIYETIEGLKHKGLVSESVINNVRFFTAAPPSQILEYVRKKKAEITKEEHAIRMAIPEFEKLRKTKTREVKAITYTGFRGIKTAASEALDSLNPGEDVLGMGITEHKEKKFNKFWTDLSKERIKRKIMAKHIFSERNEYFKAFEKMKYTETRVLTAFTPVAVDIFGKERVLILNYKEPYSCILIHDKNTATSFRVFFLQLWSQARK